MSLGDFSTVDDLFQQASLKDRAVGAFKDRQALKRAHFDRQAAALREDFEAWAVTELGVPLPDASSLHCIIEIHDEAANRPRITYRVDGYTLRCRYEPVKIMSGKPSSSDSKEFENDDLYEDRFVIEAKTRQGGWKELETLADLGELIDRNQAC